jgi:peptidoglycan/LPS O-acetylase OafA/YrhL
MNTQTTYLASKPHYEILDGLRGVAAIMVIIFHLFETHSLGNHLIQIINHGYLAVDFFFMLSGFVIGYAYDDRWDKMTLGTFFKRRIIRLHPMVIMGSIVGAALFYFQQSSLLYSMRTPIFAHYLNKSNEEEHPNNSACSIAALLVWRIQQIAEKHRLRIQVRSGKKLLRKRSV